MTKTSQESSFTPQWVDSQDLEDEAVTQETEGIEPQPDAKGDISIGSIEANEIVDDQVERTRQAIGTNSVYESIGVIIDKLCDLSGEEKEGTMNLVIEQCVKYLGMDREKAEKTAEEAEKFLAKLKVTVDNVEIGEDAVSHAKAMLCEPILRDNISGEAALAMASELVVRPISEMKKMASTGQGYEGVLYCDPRTGAITVAAEALTGEYRDKNGNNIKLNVRHMLGHEMSHPVVEDVFFQDKNEANAEAMNFAREIIDMAQKAKAERVPLPAHIETELEVLANLQAQHAQILPDSDGNKVPFEQYRAWRENRAAREILTDLTACYLQSDRSNGSSEDSIDGFIAECINNISSSRMYEYLQSSSEIRGDAADRIRAYFNTNKEERSSIIEAFPELSETFSVYEKFHSLARKYLSRDSIKAAAGKGAIREQGDNEYDAGMYSDYYDNFSSQSDAAGPQSKEESMGKAGMGLLQAFAEEVGKPVNTLAA